ncbi:MAG: hypothetical protein ACKOK8_15040, partial [Planctomycetia bacterium]
MHALRFSAFVVILASLLLPTASSGLGTSGRLATGMTCTSGTRTFAGQPGRPVTGWRDHSLAGTLSAVG